MIVIQFKKIKAVSKYKLFLIVKKEFLQLNNTLEDFEINFDNLHLQNDVKLQFI